MFTILSRRLNLWVLVAVVVATTFLGTSPRTQAVTIPLQIGWYTGVGVADRALYEKEVAAGQTIQVAYYYRDPAPYLTLMHQLKIKTILELEEEPTAAGNIKSLVAFVNAYKNDPAIAGWYLSDEPDMGHIPASVVVAEYQAIKAADPNHPVFVSFGDEDCSYIASDYDKAYFDAEDIVMFPKYPVGTQAEFGPGPTGHTLLETPAVVADCISYLKNRGKGQKFYYIGQGFNWGGSYNGLENRDPTYGEERYMTFEPLTQDIDGYLYWVDYRASDELLATVNTVMKEASSLGTAIINGVHNDPAISIDNGTIEYRFGNDGTNTYLIAVNNSGTTQNVTFTLPTSMTAASASLVYDAYNTSTRQYKDRTISLPKSASGQRTLTDTFTQYQVHIYRFPGV